MEMHYWLCQQTYDNTRASVVGVEKQDTDTATASALLSLLWLQNIVPSRIYPVGHFFLVCNRFQYWKIEKIFTFVVKMKNTQHRHAFHPQPRFVTHSEPAYPQADCSSGYGKQTNWSMKSNNEPIWNWIMLIRGNYNWTKNCILLIKLNWIGPACLF